MITLSPFTFLWALKECFGINGKINIIANERMWNASSIRRVPLTFAWLVKRKIKLWKEAWKKCESKNAKKNICIFIKNVFGWCYIYLQTVELELTRRFSFVNLFAFVCELDCIYMWIFETLLVWLDSQMHFFQQGTLCSQSDASLVFSQSHDCCSNLWVQPPSLPVPSVKCLWEIMIVIIL